jgi:hypothetical protein
VLVGSQRFRSRAFVGLEQSSRLERFNRLAHVIGAALWMWLRLPATSYSRSLTVAKSRSKVAHEPSDSSPVLPSL